MKSDSFAIAAELGRNAGNAVFTLLKNQRLNLLQNGA
jgi:hypothetical protein